jgi:ABC-type phosphate transport system permease subunit
LLASIFTPRIIMMVVGAIVVIVAIGVGIALYINKRSNP